MIEINLARQLQLDTVSASSGKLGYGAMCVVLLLAMGAASWWWTHIKQQELQTLIQEKQHFIQSSGRLKTTLSQLEQYREDEQVLRASFDEVRARENKSRQAVLLLNGVSRGMSGLDIWLHRIQIMDHAVELRGQSFAVQEIGNYVDALETHGIITSSPSLEIIDHEKQNAGQGFRFVLRFTVTPRRGS